MKTHLICAVAVFMTSMSAAPSLSQDRSQISQAKSKATTSVRIPAAKMKKRPIPFRLERKARQMVAQSGKQPTAGSEPFTDWDFVDVICDEEEWVAICDTPDCHHGIVYCDGHEIPF